MTKFSQTLIASVVGLTAAGVNAAAFQLAEVSTSGLGMAYAGNAAVANDASVVATNPALMTKFKQVTFSAGGVYVDANVDVSGTYGTTINGSYIAIADASQSNVIPKGFIPNMYIIAPINDRFAIGGGMNVNYGLKSRYSTDYNAGIFGGNTELKAINLNLSGAYDLGYGFSFGAGLNAIYSDAEVIRHLGVSGKALSTRLTMAAQNPNFAAYSAQLNNAAASLAQMENSSEISRLSGDKWSFGWNAGLSYDINENHRIGIAYRSAVNVKFKGEYSNAFPTAYNTLLNQLSALGVALPISEATGSSNIPGKLTLHLPAYWEVSTYHKLTDKFAMQFSYKRTEWSRLKSLHAYGERGNTLFHKTENYSDSSRVALGASYDISEKLTVRAGVAYDENASVTNPSISIPDTDRTWYSVGATYRFTPNLSTDIGFAHLRGSKNRFNEDGRGMFEVKSKANLYGLNVNYSF